jgi:hypothetical protein
MAVLQIANLTPSTPIEIGSMIVIDNMQAREYDSKTDSLDDVIGVIYPSINYSGRAFNIGDSPAYYNFDYNLWNDDLSLALDEFDQTIENPNYQNFNPWYDTGNYSTILTHGMGPVLKTYGSIPSRWKILDEKTDFYWVLLR